MRFYSLLCFVFLFLFTGCGKEKKTEIQLGFYHWKNHFNLSESEEKYLEKLNCKKIYLRFFDVDWDEKREEAIPLSVLTPGSFLSDSMEIIPTIFITNRTMKNISEAAIPQLAERMIQKIEELIPEVSDQVFSEIQIDCDWTKTSRSNYFLLLKTIKTKLKKSQQQLSTTIRLHQLKYPESTGIPPADRGMLMCYNVADLQDVTIENSILDTTIVARYLTEKSKAYPLELDIALPVFNWGVLYRDGRLIKLIHQLSPDELRDIKLYAQKNKNRYEVIQNTYLRGHYVYTGDEIRLEKIEKKVLKNIAAVLKNKLNKANRMMVFYHLDSMAVEQFPVEFLKQLK